MPKLEKKLFPWMPKKRSENWAYDKRYHSNKWRKYRARFLKAHPLCVECKKAGRIRPSKVVDHIIPVSQGGEFWRVANHQALCERCHNRKTAISSND